jgi:hypothetical protein
MPEVAEGSWPPSPIKGLLPFIFTIVFPHLTRSSPLLLSSSPLQPLASHHSATPLPLSMASHDGKQPADVVDSSNKELWDAADDVDLPPPERLRFLRSKLSGATLPGAPALKGPPPAERASVPVEQVSSSSMMTMMSRKVMPRFPVDG